jgi:hypothetical protein
MKVRAGTGARRIEEARQSQTTRLDPAGLEFQATHDSLAQLTNLTPSTSTANRSPPSRTPSLDSAIQRHADGEAALIAYVLKDCLWKSTKLKEFQILPRGARPLRRRSKSSSSSAPRGRGGTPSHNFKI